MRGGLLRPLGADFVRSCSVEFMEDGVVGFVVNLPFGITVVGDSKGLDVEVLPNFSLVLFNAQSIFSWSSMASASSIGRPMNRDYTTTTDSKGWFLSMKAGYLCGSERRAVYMWWICGCIFYENKRSGAHKRGDTFH